ncbi:MAG TPA: sulfotransferase [Woeseiaceae bacterium]|nr:sulfotransferase [Woeseiaceae bacterium]
MPHPARRTGIDLVPAALAGTAGYGAAEIASMLARPVIILSAPRSGSTLLFELMLRMRGTWSIGGESHAIFNAFPHLRAENAALDSGCLDERHADPQTCERMRAAFLFLLRDHTSRRYLDRPPPERPAAVRLIEKTPRNALNVPFLLRLFPDARFVYLHRDPRAAVASLIEAWTLGLRTGRFSTFPDLPGWDRRTWCFLLPPGWRATIGKPLAEIAAFQWSAANGFIADRLAALAPERWMVLSYEALVGEPAEALRRVATFAGVDAGNAGNGAAPLPVSRTALTPPHPDKWRRHEEAMRPLLPALEQAATRIEALAARQS